MNLDEARERAARAAGLNAFISFTKERGPGPAVAVKDLIDVRGVPTTGGGVILPREPAAADAEVVTRIRAAGCGVVGKTNLFEWAYGASSRNPHFGDVRNPRDPGRSAGGSSSGSAAAVAAGLCDWAIGTDTAGSVRVPAAFCGIVGFRPSHGSVPTGNVIPLSPTLDTVGVLAPSVRVAAEALAVLAGQPAPAWARDEGAPRWRLAIPAGWITGLDEQTARVWAQVSDGLASVGLPDLVRMHELAITIQSAEATAFHRDWMRRWPDRYGPDVLARLEAGIEVRAVDYLLAREEIAGLREAVQAALDDCDALVLPATTVVAPAADAPEDRAALLRFTRPFSLTGHPAIVIPAPAAGLAVGIQLVGKIGGDLRLAEVARTLERSWGESGIGAAADVAGSLSGLSQRMGLPGSFTQGKERPDGLALPDAPVRPDPEEFRVRHDSLSRSRAFRWLGLCVAVASVMPAALPALAAGTAQAGRPTAGSARAVVANANAPAGQVLLVTGDKLEVRPTPAGGEAVGLEPGQDGDPVVILGLGGTREYVPADALPYLGRGLDPSLFDLSALLRAETDGQIPVRLSFGAARPALPGVTITRWGARSATGYLTASSAVVFGAALARQFVADHARASYGGDGMFSGGVSMALAGAPRATVLASTGPASTGSANAVPDVPDYLMHTLTVTASNLRGRPDTGDVIFVFNADDWRRFGDPIETLQAFYHGVARFSVPAGHYWAVAGFATVTRRRITAFHIVVLPQFTVRGNDSRVHLTARAATSKVTVTTPLPAVTKLIFWQVFRGGRYGTFSYVGAIAPQGGSLWINPVRTRPTAGTLRSYTTAQLFSRSGAEGPPYSYALDFAGPPGLIPAQHFDVRRSSLAAVTERVYSGVAAKSGFGSLGGYPDQLERVLFGYDDLLRVPGTATLYLTGGPSIAWFSSYGTQGDAWHTVRAGQRLTENWNNYPLHPQPYVQLLRGRLARLEFQTPSAERVGDRLWLIPTPFSDNTIGHFGDVYGYDGSYTITQDGARIGHGNPIDGIDPVRLSAGPSVVSLSLSLVRSGDPLSPATSTTWTWRSRREPRATVPASWACYGRTSFTRRCAVQPLLTLNYQVRDLALDGIVPAEPQAIHVTVGHLQLAARSAITSASASVSYDGGSTWAPATVTKVTAGNYQVTFTPPAGTDVTLRFTAADAAGGSIDETITNAYGVAAAPPGAPRAACGPAPAGDERCFAIYQPQASVNAAIARGLTGAVARPLGLTPKEIESAYRLPVGRRTHQTVAVSIAYNTPHLAQYLAHYRRYFGLPPCTVASGCLRIVNASGHASPLPRSGVATGWSLEATLDVSMISVACPHCKILVVEGKDPTTGALARTEDTAARLGAQVISNSYGEREGGRPLTYAKAYSHPGHTIVVSSGDTGFTAAMFPADLSTVTAVGGTELARAHNARGWSERVWNARFAAGGSGCSAYVKKPSWQHDPHCPGRTVADVSAVASNIPIYNRAYGGWITVSGTSVAAPLVAGIYGLAGNAATIGLGYAYAHPGALFDIVRGNNSIFFPPRLACGDDYLCVAKRGYDAPTGLGSPDGIGAF